MEPPSGRWRLEDSKARLRFDRRTPLGSSRSTRIASRSTPRSAVHLSPSALPPWTFTPKALGLFPGGLLDASLVSAARDLEWALGGPVVRGQQRGDVGQRARFEDLLG